MSRNLKRWRKNRAMKSSNAIHELEEGVFVAMTESACEVRSTHRRKTVPPFLKFCARLIMRPMRLAHAQRGISQGSGNAPAANGGAAIGKSVTGRN